MGFGILTTCSFQTVSHSSYDDKGDDSFDVLCKRSTGSVVDCIKPK